ncbi:hypothetical protein CkaCkLH20_12234 [Colletotrichum karsti]|uniref:Uncharacterized protein n=1 Tax=Colletotrichum karsti TaxID=1095194 RepID=A0A9P6LF76_9PEZI|nr:uncharacterized protein CkaCkLH20_12234 [Colletotrichum karsti]KAF9870270.1 hypothetical protein CkaCkLH20_12234 [Colletotrichum karsti]
MPSSSTAPYGTILTWRRKKARRRRRTTAEPALSDLDEFEFRVAFSSTEIRWVTESEAQLAAPDTVFGF